MITITGANGRFGRQLAHYLADQGWNETVSLTTRDPARVADLADRGFQVLEADFSDPMSLRKAFLNTETLFLISATGPARDRIPLHRNAIDAAEAVGVRRVIYTSRVAPYASSPYPFAAIHDDSERYLRASKLDWTFLRNNEFTENLDPWLDRAVDSGVFQFAAMGPIAFISRIDAIRASAAVINGQHQEGKAYEFSGPEALDRNGIASVLTQACGRLIRADPGSSVDYGSVLAEMGRPQFLVEMAIGLGDASAAGEWSQTSRDPELLTGTPMTSVSDHILARFAR